MPLAFVDVETTGLNPTENRIAEIGVVTVDGERVERWTTLVKTSPRRESTSLTVAEPDGIDDAPLFSNIAAGLAQRLSGRLLVAHNARFDHAFLRAEFDRIGMPFSPQIVCSVMLSRRLDPQHVHHDLDSLIDRHGLQPNGRHRALPDADLVWQWWQVIHRRHSVVVIGDTIENLLAGPVLPPQLDPSLIDRLPQTPGAYVLHGEHARPLVVGAACNLRLHILNYFRIDHATKKALEYSHRVTNITWRETSGMLGAQLEAATLDNVVFARPNREIGSAAFTWQLSPDAIPSIAVVPVSDSRILAGAESFGLFATERKARNALVRLATKHRLCHCLLGISEFAKARCRACPVDQPATGCMGLLSRKKALVHLFKALRPLRLSPWPHRGAVGIRERSHMHIADQWHFLGTAKSESDVHEILQTDPRGFDTRLYRLLDRTMSRLARNKIVDLYQYRCRSDRYAP